MDLDPVFEKVVGSTGQPFMSGWAENRMEL